MNNLLSYFGLVDARISASEKDLPVGVVPANFKTLTVPSQTLEFCNPLGTITSTLKTLQVTNTLNSIRA